MASNRIYVLTLIGFSAASVAFAQAHREYIPENDPWSITVIPETLQVSARPDKAPSIVLSQGQTNLGRTSAVNRSGNRLRWEFPDRSLSVDLSLNANELCLDFTVKRPSTLTWPVTQAIDPVEALILPHAEGIYVPLDNRRWTEYLVSQAEWNTLEQLSMPFWGWYCDAYCLTWIVTNPFNNTIAFSDIHGSLQFDVTHEFTRFAGETRHGFRILLSRNTSPVEPARQFRRYLMATGQFVSLEQKTRDVPRVNRLRGAAHVYLWGDGLFSRHNVPSPKVPIGSEGGCYLFAPTIRVSEGIFGPLLGWGDPDHTNRQSPYYLGGYYPPDGPAVFIKQAPIKEEYRFFNYDPRFRLPLYEIVYHDSVVTTHHWANASLKFNTILDTVELTELLYLVQPLYHLNRDEFAKHQDTIERHYAIFSRLHRQFGVAPMTDFRWLSDNRLVQCTTFADQLEIVVNFSTESYLYGSHILPAGSMLAYDKTSGVLQTYTP